MKRRIEYMPVLEIQPALRNAKAHDVGAIEASINRFGFADAVVLDERTRRLVSGHGRVETLQALAKAGGAIPEGVEVIDGQWHLPVQRGWTSKSDAEAEAFIIAANRIGELGGWDDPMLEAMLRDQATAGSLLGTGYDGDDVDKMINDSTAAALGATDPNEVPDVTKVWVKPGQVFELGTHRIMCGDSTNAADVDKLTRKAKFELVWTDPPYGVDYESIGRKMAGKPQVGKVLNDGKAGLPALLRAAFAECMRVLKPGAHIYVAHPAGGLSVVFSTEFVGAGFTFKQGLVWDKEQMVMGHSDYHYDHEPLIYGIKPGADGRRGRGGKGWYGDNSQKSVLRFPRPKRSDDHPTMKPIELVEACVRNSSAPGHFVFEPFSGSGTTLLACERLQRICCAMELDPKFVQVAIERWEAFTGLKHRKVS